MLTNRTVFLMIFAVITNGAILSAYGYYMPWYTMGGAFVLTGGALMYTVDVNSSVSFHLLYNQSLYPHLFGLFDFLALLASSSQV